MDRESAIEIIEGLYPADSKHESVRHKGQQLLNQAKREAIGWRTEPTHVLQRYAELCLDRDRQG